MPFDRLLLFGIAGAATAAILVFAYRLSRARPQAYVADYFRYLLLSAPPALMGGLFPVLVRDVISLEEVQAGRLFLLFDRLLAKPLWILSLLLLVKCVRGMLGKKLSRPFVAGYDVFWGGVLLIVWISTVRFLQAGLFSTAARMSGALFNVLDIFGPVLVFAYGIHGASRIAGWDRRTGIRIFCWLGFVSKAAFWVLVFRSFSFDIPFLFGVALPIPALLWLSVALKTEAPGRAGRPEDPAVRGSSYASPKGRP